MKQWKAMLNLVVERISLQQVEYEMESIDLPDDYNFFEIGYCGHPTLPYALIKLGKAPKLIISHSQDKYHPLIYDTFKNKKTQLVSSYFVYRPKKNASRTDPTNDYQKSYTFASTYRDGSTAFQCHMIYVVVFSYQYKLQIILVYYAVTEMGFFDDY